MSLEDVVNDYTTLVRRLVNAAEASGIVLSGLPIDHIGYRASSGEDYEAKKRNLMAQSQAYLETKPHGRLNTKCRLKESATVDGFSFDLIEVASPKEGTPFSGVLDHIEFVVPENFIEFVERYTAIWSGSEDNGPFNRTVFIATSFGYVKFHERSLDEVIRLEGKSFTAL